MSNEQLLMLLAAILYRHDSNNTSNAAAYALSKAVRIMELGHDAWVEAEKGAASETR